MRETSARALAATTGVLLLSAVVAFATLQARRAPAVAMASTAPPESVEAEAQSPDSVLVAGRTVYDELGCAGCHSIAGQGSPRSPLDGVGGRLDAEDLRAWVVDPQSIRPGIRKPAFDDLPVPDIDALVAYLQSLR